MTEQKSAGDMIVEHLIANGIDTLFGLPGVQTYPLFDALARRANHIRTISARHEQATAYMALGYAKSTGRPAAYSVVPGPGVLNTGAALCTAFGVNAPIMCVTGQSPSSFIGHLRGHLHELPDQRATLKSFIKDAYRIEHPQDTHRVMNEAWQTMVSGRQGPVAVEMAWDMMAAKGTLPEPTAIDPTANPPLDATQIEAAVKLIKRAKRPMIMVGGGAQHAGAEVLQLAEKLGVPVTSHRGGKGVIPGDHPLSINMLCAHEMWPETDLLIGIGSRLELQYMRWTGMLDMVQKATAPPQLIRIDIDAAEMRRLRPHVALVADAADACNAITEALGTSKPKVGIKKRIKAAQPIADQQADTIQPQMDYLRVIRKVLPRDGYFVDDLCQVVYASYFGWQAYEPRTYVTCGYQGTLGYGYPTALGVKVANPDKAVISVLGDGGFMFAVQELATAVQENIAVIALVFNNSSYGNVRRDQKRLFDDRTNATDLRNPDFLLLAQSFGADGYRVSNPAELEASLAMAIDTDRPAIIEIEVDREAEVSPWHLLVKQPAG